MVLAKRVRLLGFKTWSNPTFKKENKFRLTLVASHPFDVRRTTIIKTAMKGILKTLLIFRFFSMAR